LALLDKKIKKKAKMFIVNLKPKKPGFFKTWLLYTTWKDIDKIEYLGG
jgi:hypothetical protein